MILAGLYYGSKPDMAKYFMPFLEEFQTFEDNFVQLEISDQLISFQPVILSVCVDLPAKSSVQQIMQYNGYHACTYCHHEGNSIVDQSTGNRKCVRYGKCAPVQMRTHEETIPIMSCFIQNCEMKPRQGIKGFSCMVGVPRFNVIYGFSIDYMHNVLLGVMRLLLSLWTESTGKAYYVQPKNLLILNDRILALKPCQFISRKPQGLKKGGSYKANELRTLLLYYLPVCLRGILSKTYLDHFIECNLQFAAAIHQSRIVKRSRSKIRLVCQ